MECVIGHKISDNNDAHPLLSNAHQNQQNTLEFVRKTSFSDKFFRIFNRKYVLCAWCVHSIWSLNTNLWVVLRAFCKSWQVCLKMLIFVIILLRIYGIVAAHRYDHINQCAFRCTLMLARSVYPHCFQELSCHLWLPLWCACHHQCMPPTSVCIHAEVGAPVQNSGAQAHIFVQVWATQDCMFTVYTFKLVFCDLCSLRLPPVWKNNLFTASKICGL